MDKNRYNCHQTAVTQIKAVQKIECKDSAISMADKETIIQHRIRIPKYQCINVLGIPSSSLSSSFYKQQRQPLIKPFSVIVAKA